MCENLRPRINDDEDYVLVERSKSNEAAVVVRETEERDENEDENFPEGGRKAWSVAFGGLFGLTASFGLYNSVGAIQAYVEHNQLKRYSSSEVSWIFSIYIFLSLLLSATAGPFLEAYGPLYLTILGLSLQIAGLLCLSFSKQYYQFVLSFGLSCGVAGSLLFTPTIATIGQWFKVKRGQATGLASIGGSLGGVIFPVMLRALYSSVGFAWAIRILALIQLVLLSVQAVMVRARFTSTKKFPLLRNIVEVKCFKEPIFNLVVAGVFCCELALLNIQTFYTSQALAVGVSENKSYLLLSILNGVGIPGRYLPGLLSDRLGRFNTMIAASAVATASIFAILLPAGNSYKGLMTFAVLFGLGSASILSLIPVCIGQISSTRDYGKRYGAMYGVLSIGGLIGVPVSGLLLHGSTYLHFNTVNGILYFCGLLFFILSRYQAVGLKLVVF